MPKKKPTSSPDSKLNPQEVRELIAVLQDPAVSKQIRDLTKLMNDINNPKKSVYARRSSQTVVHDRFFLEDTLRELSTHGIRDIWVFGGWAEELLQRKPAWQHSDIDLLYRARDFSKLDQFLRQSPWEEIAEKRLPHKRAYVRHGIRIELFLVQGTPATGYTTNFFGKQLFRWPPSTFEFSRKSLSIVSPEALDAYRAKWSTLHNV